MPPSAHLQAVPDPGGDHEEDHEGDASPGRARPTAAQLQAHADGMTTEADCLAAALGEEPDLDGAELVLLRETIIGAIGALGEARRLVERLGHNWVLRNGRRGRADIDGVPYRATVNGSATSLKVADRERLADTFFRERLAPWLADALGEDPADDASTTRLWLSLVVEKLNEVFTLAPRAAPLAERWGLDAASYETPTTGVGPVPSFEKAPAPKAPAPITHPRSTAS